MKFVLKMYVVVINRASGEKLGERWCDDETVGGNIQALIFENFGKVTFEDMQIEVHIVQDAN